MPIRRPVAAVAALLLVVTLEGCSGGSGGDSATSTTSAVAADQTVTIKMQDIKFAPDTVTVKAGTTVRFMFENDGQLVHEAAFGDDATQNAVESGKAKRDGPQLDPNKKADFVVKFGPAGQMLIGCHIPGHYSAGMKVRITIQ